MAFDFGIGALKDKFSNTSSTNTGNANTSSTNATQKKNTTQSNFLAQISIRAKGLFCKNIIDTKTKAKTKHATKKHINTH